MKLSKVIFFIACVFILGCAGSPARVLMMDEEDIKTVDSYNICKSYIYFQTYGGNDKVEAEMERRKIFTCGSFTQIREFDRISEVKDPLVCNAYNYNIRANMTNLNEMIVEEINKRKLLSPEEWELVKNKKIKIGMSLCGLLASWGKAYPINSSVSASGNRTQHVYRQNDAYVYTQNGYITSWQASR